jgi:hypothetical protein
VSVWSRTRKLLIEQSLSANAVISVSQGAKDPLWDAPEWTLISPAGTDATNRSRIVAMKTKRKFLLIAFTTAVIVSVPSPERAGAQENQMRAIWVDPSTGLMWARKDNGKDVSWRRAMKYCRGLRLDGHSDWRLANMAELQGIYDKTVEAPGLAGPTKALRGFTWHVKGNLFLTGEQWSGHQVTDRMPLESYEYHFDFNSGMPDKDPSGWPYPSVGMRALCVRGPERETACATSIPAQSRAIQPVPQRTLFGTGRNARCRITAISGNSGSSHMWPSLQRIPRFRVHPHWKVRPFIFSFADLWPRFSARTSDLRIVSQ